jgi:flagellar basal body-associated protein FliL
MKRGAPPSAQRGVALLALLVMLLLAGGYAFYRSSNLGDTQNQERDTVMQRLVRAKEAVIAYAVNDTTRPGRLLCPDQIGDGMSPLFVLNECASYGGLLPWKTLDLPDNTDTQGGNFRYHLSPAFGGQSPAAILNSETATTLRLDVPASSNSNDIAAVIIATRGVPDARNADGNDFFYNHDRTNELSTPEDNDIVIAITRQELMAAVEQRIANELRTCLEQHSRSTNTYPWPAPFSRIAEQVLTNTANATMRITNAPGFIGSLFGMVPDTQPGNPEQALQGSTVSLRELQTTLAQAQTPTTSTLSALQAEAANAMALYDRIFLAAVALYDSAFRAGQSLAQLEGIFDTATASKESYSALSQTIPAAITANQAALDEFRTALADSGFDLFVGKLILLNQNIESKLSQLPAQPTSAQVRTVLDAVTPLRNGLLENSQSSDLAIDNAISSTHALATSAVSSLNTARKQLSSEAVAQARADTVALLTASQSIEPIVLASRAAATPGSTADNVALESIAATINLLATGQNTAPTKVTAARELAKTIDILQAWISIAIELTPDLAGKARKGIVGGQVALENRDSAAYTAASQLLNSLAGSGGAIAVLSNATSSSEEIAAAIDNLRYRLNALIAAADALDDSLRTGFAQAAIPTRWSSAECAFLTPTSSQGNWWTQGNWKSLFFYQVSAQVRPPSGTLTVNGAGNYRAVVIGAGRALSSQSRPNPDVRNYLEKGNGDLSRNGDALAPTPRFVVETVSPSFNDRLAY